MPKIKSSGKEKLNRYVSENKDIFKTDGTILFCKMCNKGVSFATKFQVNQHLHSSKHIELQQRKLNLSQSFLPESANTLSKFSTDLCDALIAADIPLDKLDNQHLTNFLKKYTNEIIPCSSTLRKTYINKLFDSQLSDIKSQLKNNFLWVSIDETTDIQGRFIANVIVGIMHIDEEVSKQKFLLNVVELEKTNHSTIARAFDDSIKLLGDDFDRNKILLYLTDAAPYMVKAGNGLRLFYEKLLHVTCLAHALHRVAEMIRYIFKDVDDLIANGKKIFLKAPARVEAFRKKFPELALPPEPVITRWGTWIEAAAYYAKYFESFTDIVNELEEGDALSIRKTKVVLQSVGIKEHLAFISSNYGFLSETITKLEGRMSLKQQIILIEEAKQKIDAVDGTFAEQIKEKLNSVLKKNIGFEKIKDISKIIDFGEENSVVKNYAPNELAAFKNAPLTSVDVERSFSLYKNFYRPNRTYFTFDNMRKQFILYANKAMSES